MSSILKTCAICLLGLFVVLGCSSTSSYINKKEKSEDLLKQRVEAFMQGKVANNWAAVYDFLDADFKKSMSQEKFAAYPRKTAVVGYTIESTQLIPSGIEADVMVKEDISMRGYTFKGIAKKQHWIIEKGKWVLIERPQAVTPPTVPK